MQKSAPVSVMRTVRSEQLFSREGGKVVAMDATRTLQSLEIYMLDTHAPLT
jgi:hypothetical protein